MEIEIPDWKALKEQVGRELLRARPRAVRLAGEGRSARA